MTQPVDELPCSDATPPDLFLFILFWPGFGPYSGMKLGWIRG
jgi:hypothetical protein